MSERRALKLAGMSPSVLRYARRDDGNGELRERIVAMAHRHRRHGYRMIHLRLRQPLIRPSRANEVWSMDFVFDRLADGRGLTHKSVI